jgi:tetratricopeptide (TPR) repeat protein
MESLPITKYGDAADSDKLAMFEKNIALAFFNKGQYANALEYFDRVLKRLGERSSKNQIIIAYRLISDFLNLIKNLYLPSKKATKIASKNDNEIFDLCYKRATLLVYVDPKRCFIEYLRALTMLNKFDITKIENRAQIWLSASGLFSSTGISFKISKKILVYAKGIIKKNDIKDLLYYNLFELLQNFYTGNWHEIKEYDENLVDLNLGIGASWHLLTYIVFHCFKTIDQGVFKETEIIISKLSEIWEDYENEDAREYQCSLRIKLLMKSRKLNDAQIEADAGISFQRETGRELATLYYFGFKSIIQVLLNDIDGAKESLLQAKELISEKGAVAPLYIGTYLMGQFLYDLYLLEESILSDDNSKISEYRKKAHQSGRKALKNSGKHACDKIETFKLMGFYYWLIGRQDNAVNWWDESIKEGERLGERVELARTYMEIGKRLLEEKSRFHELNGIKAEDYLEKARTLFEEMDLQWDLDELDKIIAYSLPSSIAI